MQEETVQVRCMLLMQKMINFWNVYSVYGWKHSKQVIDIDFIINDHDLHEKNVDSCSET